MQPAPTPTRPLGFAHRGARAHAPENTLEAFVTARRMGATALESDVWLTADGVAVLDHDGVVGRRGRSRPISSVPAAQLPTHIPTLADLYRACGTGVDLSLDVKDPEAAGEVLRVARAAGADAIGRLWLCDPDPGRLASWRAADPDVRLVASVRRRTLVLDRRSTPAGLAAAGIDTLNLRGDTWTPGLIERCHEAGVLAFGWGVQWGAEARLLLGWGIDALYSDHVDRMQGWLADAAR